MTKRGPMSPQRRLKIFEQHKGLCCLCGGKIDGTKEAWIVEHIRALGLDGEDKDENCGPAHETCRRIKDKDDVARISKAKRVKARHVGARVPKGQIKSAGFPRFDKPRHGVDKSQLPPLPKPQLFAPADRRSEETI
jgi:5-methylcytosine-specific restriction endonuclease McrA